MKKRTLVPRVLLQVTTKVRSHLSSTPDHQVRPSLAMLPIYIDQADLPTASNGCPSQLRGVPYRVFLDAGGQDSRLRAGACKRN
jgi:hypothetical protein